MRPNANGRWPREVRGAGGGIMKPNNQGRRARIRRRLGYTPRQVAEIILRHHAGETLVSIGSSFDVTRQSILSLLNGRRASVGRVVLCEAVATERERCAKLIEGMAAKYPAEVFPENGASLPHHATCVDAKRWRR